MNVKMATSEHLKDHNNYGIYFVNIFDDGLNTIKDEYKRKVRTGLRPNVVVLDLSEAQTERNNLPGANTKMSKEFQDNFHAQMINLIVQNIQAFRSDYELKMKKINEELKFDLYQYWLKEPTTTNKARTKKPLKEMDKTSYSSSLVATEPNRLSQSMLRSRNKYIKDEPVLDKLYIIILGQQMSSELFYKDLLSVNQYLDGIINFIPTESNYDIMLANDRRRNFINSTLQNINHSNYKLRQEDILKSVGLFTLKLPVISDCLARKYSREIFDELTWSIYDVDMLRQQYEHYYLKPFQLIDVAIPASDNLTELYHVAEALSMRAQHQKSLLPTSNADLASIAFYLNSLLNSCCCLQDHLLKPDSNAENLNPSQSFANAFLLPNALRLSRSAESNKFLLNMLQYTNLQEFRSIYLCCLDYNALAKYAITPQLQYTSASGGENCDTAYSQSSKMFNLPQYVKYYPNADCSCPRITELQNAYDECEIADISTGYKLYTFKRRYNVLIEKEGCRVIPTRLCFRDFTLFEMEDFLKELQKPRHNTSNMMLQTKEAVEAIELEETIFIRPNSLKARAQAEENQNNKNAFLSAGRKGSKSSSALSFNKLEGLPSDHSLLKGYNLGDTLQEIKYKTSKYYFRNGFVKLYEEKWCRQDMNKQLSVTIDGATWYFFEPRQRPQTISNNIRLLTKNNSSIRILNDVEEPSKIVLTYPKGLSIFYRQNCCEQIWHDEETTRSEQRRIYTHFGAVIVFFKSPEDLIMILRYNGEVYRLYQHELSAEEEEQEDNSVLDGIEKNSSGYEDLKSQGDSLLSKERSVSGQSIRNKKQSALYEQSITGSTDSKPAINSIAFELEFLNFLCSIYNLTYLHLTITTSQGKRINLNRLGEYFEGHNCSLNEWHDYFANEAYCERSDGVKMLWTQDYLKCFHPDGTVFTTAIEDDVTEPDELEYESQISQSSSHIGFLGEMEVNGETYKDGADTSAEKLTSAFNSIQTISAADEDGKAIDVQFKRYKCKSWLMHHQNYAEVFILTPRLPNSSPRMEIFGMDNVRLLITSEEDNYNSRTATEEYKKDKMDNKLVVNVWIGEKLHTKVDHETCIIDAFLSQSTHETDKSLILSLSLKYADCINDAFKEFIKNVASVAKLKTEQQLEEVYFIEKINGDQSIRGFEFFKSLPIISKYKYRVSNSITEMRPVNSIIGSESDNNEKYKEDLKKFPRFKETRQEKTFKNPANEFPRCLSANVYIEIPKQLLSLSNIVKFLEPFEDMHFKSLRPKFKNVLSLHLEPQKQFKSNIFRSKKKWQKYQSEHEKRISTEKQRLQFYNAMNEHKTYPTYWKFTQCYKSDVKSIDFLDFMHNQCNKKKIQLKQQLIR